MTPRHGDRRLGHGERLWVAGSFVAVLPQAMAPLAFSLGSLAVTGDTTTGPAMMGAMTAAQILCSVPVASMGHRFAPRAFVVALLGLRSAILAVLASLFAVSAAPWALILCAGAAGAFNGAILGHLRQALNQLSRESRRPRVLALSITLNEVLFAGAPLLSSALAQAAPWLPILTMALSAALTIRLLPHWPAAPAASTTTRSRRRPTPLIYLWLLCTTTGGAVVASAETGAVALTVALGLASHAAAVFPLLLCCLSIVGGAFVTFSGRRIRFRLIAAMLLVTASGGMLIAVSDDLITALIGTGLVGLCLAPLGTAYSLELDVLLTPDQKVTGFSLLRVAQASGIVLASALLTALHPMASFAITAALTAASCLILVACRRPLLAAERRLARPSDGAGHPDGGTA
ncbi:MAG: hypothetical protein QM628_11005 [Propionicimonas sp.]